MVLIFELQQKNKIDFSKNEKFSKTTENLKFSHKLPQ